MKIVIAENSGFCDGVKRAMRIALEASAKHGGLAADGPLVHNRQALELLALQGVKTNPAGNRSLPALIRAHGITPERRQHLANQGKLLVDATCAHVAHNQKLAAQASADGFAVVLAGDPDHAESRAVAGSAGNGCAIIATPEEAARLAPDRPVFLMAQTTFNVPGFEAIAHAVRQRFPDCVVADTICRATHARQEEAARLARQVDVMVVVGGKNSANTNRLAEIGRAAGIPVFLVETAAELRETDFTRYRTAAVISGASTPGWITQEVVNRLRRMGRTPLSAQGLRFLYPLVESRALTALSAGGLGLAAGLYLNGRLNPAVALAGAAYVFFAHTLNRRVPPNPEARRVSLVDSFYQARRSPFLIAAWLAAGLALALSAAAGPAVAILFAGAILATLVYALPSLRSPAWLARLKRNRLPRNWPMAAGWALVLAVPPALPAGTAGRGAGAALFIFLVCLGTTLVRDLHDIASDRLMGIDTLPARIGHQSSIRLARAALAAATVLPFLAVADAVFRQGAPFSRWLVFTLSCSLVPAAGLWLLRQVEKRRIHDAVLLQGELDGAGCLAGLLALAMGVAA